VRLFDSGEQNPGQRLQIQHVRSGRLDQLAKLHGPLCLERLGPFLKRLQLAVDIRGLRILLSGPSRSMAHSTTQNENRVTHHSQQIRLPINFECALIRHCVTCAWNA
jgi:hypothetical protein